MTIINTVISYEYIYIYVFGGWYDSFYHWPNIIWCLAVRVFFIEIQDVQMMNGIYGDMTLYGHATIIGGQQVHI